MAQRGVNRPLTVPNLKKGERLTGRLAYCGRSNTNGVHPLVAVPVRVAASGVTWAYCTCGWRSYYPKDCDPDAEGFTREQVLAAGAIAF